MRREKLLASLYWVFQKVGLPALLGIKIKTKSAARHRVRSRGGDRFAVLTESNIAGQVGGGRTRLTFKKKGMRLLLAVGGEQIGSG